ncbi:MAG: hypothetical protein ACRCTE_02005 [Cellulosilyticaceae bacterium]
MKKSFFVSILLVLLVALTGCNTTQMELWQKANSTNNWKAMDVSAKMTMEIAADGETIKMNTDMNQYSVTETLDTYIKMNMGISASDQNMNLKNIEIYMLDGKVYISKNYVTAIYETAGIPIPQKVKDLKADYLALDELNGGNPMMDLALKMQGQMGNKAFADEANKMIVDMAKQLKLDIPVVKEGDTYTITLDSKQIVAIVMGMMDEGAANIDKLNKDFKLNLKPEDIAQVKAWAKASASDKAEVKAMLESLVKGNVKISYTFVDKGVNFKMEMNIDDIADAGLSMKFSYEGNMKEAAVKTLKVPGKVVETSLNALMAQ